MNIKGVNLGNWLVLEKWKMSIIFQRSFHRRYMKQG